MTAASLALAGCGASGPTRSQYRARAEAICQPARAQVTPLIQQVASALAAPGGVRSSQEQLAAALQDLYGVAASYLARLEGLKQPSGDHAAIERFLESLSEVVAGIGRAGAMVRGGAVSPAIRQLLELEPTQQEANTAAQAYGLTECAAVLPALREVKSPQSEKSPTG